MLFSETKSETIRDHLIRLTEAAVFCMRVLEVPCIPGAIRTKEAHQALYEALVPIVDANIANNFEFGYILDQACRKIQPLILEDKISTSTHSDSHRLGLSNRHPIQLES